MKNSMARMQAGKRTLIAHAFLLPSMIGLLLFNLIPLLFSLFISMTDWNFVKGIGNWNFVGLNNFISLCKDEWFVASLRNTLLYTIVTVPTSQFLALIIAVLIDRFCKEKLAGVLRIAMYMPNICNIVASSAVWMALLSPYGPFTLLVKALGWTDPPKWLADPFWALPALMLVGIWQNLGYRVFLYGAAITGLPKDIYEAADIDGAGFFTKYLRITIPMLQPTTFFLTITGIIASFKVFGTINVMTQGGPSNSTYTIVYYIYKRAFSYYEMGDASAMAVVLFLIMLAITLFQWHYNKKSEQNF